MRFGELMLHAEKLDVKPSALFDILFHDQGKGLLAVGHALLGWTVVLVPLCVVLTVLLQPAFVEIKKRWAAPVFPAHAAGMCSACVVS